MTAFCLHDPAGFARIYGRMPIRRHMNARAGALLLCPCQSGRFNPQIACPRRKAGKAEASPNDNGKHLSLALKAARMFTWEMNLETQSIVYSSNANDVLGADPSVAFYPGGANIHPDDRPFVEEAYERALSKGGGFIVECRLVTSGSGKTLWVRNQGVFDNAPVNSSFFGVVQDVTELKLAQGKEKAWDAEIRHVTRNLLATVRAISNQILCSSPSLEEFGARFHDRLTALSRVQAFLYRSSANPITIAELARTEIAAYSDELAGACVVFDGPEVVVPRRAVQILALTLHELASNAVAHGALSTPSGRIKISWHVQHAARKGKKLKFIWRESGLNLPEGIAPRQGFGRFLLERAVPYELNARTSFELSRDGVQWTIELPLAKAE